jgi:hypothetical protein
MVPSGFLIPEFVLRGEVLNYSADIETPGNGVSVNVVPATCPCSIWNSSSDPATADSGDGNAVELGVKFREDTAGVITGVRFYKSGANTGTHVGHVWSSTGTLLGTANFTSESLWLAAG